MRKLMGDRLGIAVTAINGFKKSLREYLTKKNFDFTLKLI